MTSQSAVPFDFDVCLHFLKLVLVVLEPTYDQTDHILGSFCDMQITITNNPNDEPLCVFRHGQRLYKSQIFVVIFIFDFV